MCSLWCAVYSASCAGLCFCVFVLAWTATLSNIKVSQPMQRLVIIAHRVLVDFLNKCDCVPACCVGGTIKTSILHLFCVIRICALRQVIAQRICMKKAANCWIYLFGKTRVLLLPLDTVLYNSNVSDLKLAWSYDNAGSPFVQKNHK